ncbi:hypothetical protein CSC62_13905 [Pseudoxanthomonas jiangsuensis]|nr:hypothetical protein CSC62_13905 [Pseudoxanthomonas jiangsuensis]
MRAVLRAALARGPVPELSFEARTRLAAAYPFRRRQAIREITHLADRWGWRRVVDQTLAETGAHGLKSLDADQLEALLARLRTFEDALQTAADPADAPPAR